MGSGAVSLTCHPGEGSIGKSSEVQHSTCQEGRATEKPRGARGASGLSAGEKEQGPNEPPPLPSTLFDATPACSWLKN